MSNLVLPLDAFIRSIGINKSVPHLFFIGAGASVSSGVPSAKQCIWEWKRSIFLTRNPGIEEQFSELSLSAVRERIQEWLDRQGGFPPRGDSEEYGFYIEACFPIANDRRAYFQEKVQHAQPHIGYRLLCQLALIGMVRGVWTTNFDALAARAASAVHLTPVEVGIDSQHRIVRFQRKGELLCVSMHGDYRYDHLKNTGAEIQEQESELCAELVSQLQESPVVVVGYSGRDTSIMETFRKAYSSAGSGALYWCGYGNIEPQEPVAILLQLARRNGYPAFYVPTDGFDDLLIRLARYCCGEERQEEIKQLIANMGTSAREDRSPFQTGDYPTQTIIKSNAFELECPSEVLTFDIREWPVEHVWASVKKTVEGRPVVAVPFRGKILALGVIDDIKDAFGDNIKGEIERTPVTETEFRYEDGAVVSLMREALINAIAQRTGVSTDGKSELWLNEELKRIREGSGEYSIYDSVLVFLRRIGTQQYLLLKPSLRIQDQNGRPAPVEIAKAVKLRILGIQFNDKFNRAINRWRKKLFPDGNSTTIYEFPDNSSSSFRFKVWRSPVFAKIGSTNRRSPIALPDGVKRLVRHQGVELSEPVLLFSDKAATGHAKDTHPIRGIARNQPFDFGLTQNGLASSIRLGVVCPKREEVRLSSYLNGCMQRQRPQRANPEYLLEYPGFYQAYGVSLEIPDPDAPGWATCAEPESTDPIAGAKELAKKIIRSIEGLMAAYSPHEVLIFFPGRWSALKGFRTENERFDLHDFVKAHCVQRGISTQFLEEKTLTNKDQCSVWWWLSLALYVKSMRTPWILESLDPDTAFVGLGFSVDPVAPRGRHVVLGCSHIYSARGEGLQFRLSKIENPIFRGRNPFMSEEDARRLGETIRQLFFDARLKLPGRVVIHKRTPFIKQERDGLCEGLSGVNRIEMLEIQMDHALRYVASVQRNGRFDEDNFPVRRGTTVRLDDFTVLVWVHGSTTAIDGRRRYYQGRRRIPAPIVVRRHMGESDLQTVAQELLGLSKMNWNTFDLYTKLPATVHSSNEIARIGSLLQRFGPQSYDFRLFM